MTMCVNGCGPELVWVGGVGSLCRECYWIHKRVERQLVINELAETAVLPENRRIMAAGSRNTTGAGQENRARLNPPERADDFERRAAEYEEYRLAVRERDQDFRPDPRPDRLWRERVLERDQGCCVHTNPADCREWFQAHHVVPQQVLRRTTPEADLAAVLWHPLAGMGVCGLVHRQHHSGHTLIALDAIPLPVVDFLCGLGFGWYIERHYAP